MDVLRGVATDGYVVSTLPMKLSGRGGIPGYGDRSLDFEIRPARENIGRL